MNAFGRPINRRASAAVAAVAIAALAVLGVSGVVSAASKAAPVNTGEPAISGTATLGSTLNATAGTWSNNPTSFKYQWVRCPASGGKPDGSDCAAIAGATTPSHVLASADVGKRMRIRVTASNADGSKTVASNATAVVVAPPKNTAEPSISGTARVGSTLKATTGGWTNSPTSFTFQWMRCPPSGGKGDASDCAAITGATGQTYILSGPDFGNRLRVRVTAANAAGSATAASNPTATVRASSLAPVNTGEPRISGTARVGAALTATQGTWRNNPTSYVYQWMRCAASGGKPDASDCAAIAGATTTTYTAASADLGRRLRFRVTAANANGSSTVASNATELVAPAGPPPPAGCPSGTGPVSVNQLGTQARLFVDGQQLTPSPVGGSTTSITARFHISACNGRPVQGALVYAATVPFNQFAVGAEQPTDTDGWATQTSQRLRGFPATSKQHLLVMFVRARKPSEKVLEATARRLISFRVDLRR